MLIAVLKIMAVLKKHPNQTLKKSYHPK